MLSKLVDAGALWSKEAKKGGTYFRGTIEINGTLHRIQMHPNRYKKESKHPDYKISLELPDDDEAPQPAKTWSGTEAPDKIDPEDTPF
jgi:hypothetical protein